MFLLIPFLVDAKDYDFYVDGSAKSGGDGSVGKPFKDIENAIKKAEKKGGKQEIYIYKGTYSSGFTVGKSISLVGEDEDKVIIAGSISMADKSGIKKVTVKGGYPSVSVVKDAEVEIENCVIRDFTKIGVDIAPGGGKLTIQDSKIKNGDGKGVYVQKGNRIKFTGNEVYDNDEEGVDLRAKIKGIISGNYIYNNREGGIEVIVGDADLEISNNTIKGNKASAIAAQFYESSDDRGNIDIKNNKLVGNGNYALDCKNTQGGSIETGYWMESIKLSGNTFDDNEEGVIGKSCKIRVLDLADIDSDEKIDNISVENEEGLKEEVEDEVEDEEQLMNENKLLEEKIDERNRRQAEVKLILQKNTERLNVSKTGLEKVEKNGRVRIFFLGINKKEIETARINLNQQEDELQKAIEILGGDYSEMPEGEELKIKVNEALNWIGVQKNYLVVRENSFSLLGWIKKLFLM